MEFQRAKTLSLKAHATYNERWLQSRIAEDPSLLGLGDLVVRDVERPQPRAGRLDLLLSDPETRTRYEVEIQLGATDPAHIIRTIEYWDIERNRYPQFEHVAVIVAEDITSRFLNVINLFNKTIPLVAVQLRALEVGGVLTLNATTVLDLVRLGTEEEDEPGQATDRAYWLARGSPATVAMADELFALIGEVVPGANMNYTKVYIGVMRSGFADNFTYVQPKKQGLNAFFRVPPTEELSALLDDSGVEHAPAVNQYTKLILPAGDVTKHRDLLLDLIRRASGTPAPEMEDPTAV